MNVGAKWKDIGSVTYVVTTLFILSGILWMGYILAGRIDIPKNPDFKGQILYEDHDVWLFKTDTNGNLEWSKTIGGLKSDVARFVQQTSDGGYVIAGTTESYGSGGSDIWLVKIAGTKVDTTQSQVIISDPSNVPVRIASVSVPMHSSSFRL